MTRDKSYLQYKVGALMYTPALNANVGKKVCGGEFPELDSLALCLEDAVSECGVKNAERQLVNTLRYISKHKKDDMPLLFVRLRNVEQFRRFPKLLGELIDILTGVIFPKFDLSNAAEYCSIMGSVNAKIHNPIFMMPILESFDIINMETRKRSLLDIHKLLDGCKEYVLNIRVGAMDFSSFYGLRRAATQSIYDIGIVSDVLKDILTVFAGDYTVSAPVWEYYGGAGDLSWKKGLEKELALDIANGFIGKTVIHPSQLPLVRKWLKPIRADFEDAKSILKWEDKELGVMRSVEGNRMNELSTHQKWAGKILRLAEIYGVRD
ncbi:MAG: HpcH/HpaI aldolase/citrate lyase family protein [Treponema sp.]|jgi:citrate lyase beta subunit|nr:HpcH/HpaI aldolase/citrate lyase family protein [Treponema sp.]